jgi:diaminohydroxyphosphoribosylaminopyrimidine deaminase/5-amino-6-(5-phosphoribosylamino)uracil reductase
VHSIAPPHWPREAGEPSRPTGRRRPADPWRLYLEATRAGRRVPNPCRALDALFSPIARAPVGRPFVVAQLGQSLDGRIATVSGSSHYISGAAALEHLHRLRALVDAVVVGVGTAVADDPQLTVRRCAGESPVRVVVDPSGRLPATLRCLSDGGPPVLVVRRAGAGMAACERVVPVAPAADGSLDPNAIVAALAARGLGRLLIEGGARTVSGFVAAGAVDRLHVTVASLIIGSGTEGLCLPEIAALTDALRPPTRVHPLGDGDVLFDCDLAALRPAATEGDPHDRRRLLADRAPAALADGDRGAVRDPAGDRHDLRPRRAGPEHAV